MDDLEKAVQEAINDATALEQRIKAAMKKQGIKSLDAPYGLIYALGHLESAREDLRTENNG